MDGAGPSPVPAPGRRGLDVLVVDDDPDIRFLAEVVLTRAGANVRCSADGAEGLASAIRQPPDVILLDCVMDGWSGPEVLAALREDPATRSVPVIFLTGRAEEQQRGRLESLDARGVILKPFDPASLYPRVVSLLNDG